MTVQRSIANLHKVNHSMNVLKKHSEANWSYRDHSASYLKNRCPIEGAFSKNMTDHINSEVCKERELAESKSVYEGNLTGCPYQKAEPKASRLKKNLLKSSKVNGISSVIDELSWKKGGEAGA